LVGRDGACEGLLELRRIGSETPTDRARLVGLPNVDLGAHGQTDPGTHVLELREQRGLLLG
jgi:hypothetical protein